MKSSSVCSTNIRKNIGLTGKKAIEATSDRRQPNCPIMLFCEEEY